MVNKLEKEVSRFAQGKQKELWLELSRKLKVRARKPLELSSLHYEDDAVRHALPLYPKNPEEIERVARYFQSPVSTDFSQAVREANSLYARITTAFHSYHHFKEEAERKGAIVLDEVVFETVNSWLLFGLATRIKTKLVQGDYDRFARWELGWAVVQQEAEKARALSKATAPQLANFYRDLATQGQYHQFRFQTLTHAMDELFRQKQGLPIKTYDIEKLKKELGVLTHHD